MQAHMSEMTKSRKWSIPEHLLPDKAEIEDNLERSEHKLAKKDEHYVPPMENHDDEIECSQVSANPPENAEADIVTPMKHDTSDSIKFRIPTPKENDKALWSQRDKR